LVTVSVGFAAVILPGPDETMYAVSSVTSTATFWGDPVTEISLTFEGDVAGKDARATPT